MVTGRRILLLADDSPATQKVVSLTFADEGLEVVAVGDGAEAARRLDAGLVPAVVLADVLMPGLTGYELCERIKGDRRLAHVPVVLLVGTFEPFNEAEARRVGAETVLTKPFQSIRDLVNKVGSLIGGAKPEAEDETTRPAPPRHEATPPPQQEEESRHQVSQQEATPQQDTTAPFADLRLDDEMIEARTADNYAHADTRPHAHETQETADASLVEEAASVVEAEAAHDSFADTLRDPFADTRDAGGQRDADERREAQVYAQTQTPFAQVQVAEESRAPQAAFAARAGGAGVASDDTLLDLDIEPPASASESDDFILDLDDDMPAPSAASAVAATPAPDAAGAFAEAAHGETLNDESAAAWQSHGGEVVAEVVAQDEPHGFGGERELSEQSFSDVQDFGSHTAREVMSAVTVDAMSAASHEVSGATSDELMSTPRAFVEPEVVPAAEAPHPAGEAEFTDGSVEGDVAKPPVGGFVGAPVEASAAPFAEASAAGDSPFPPVPSTAGYEMGAARVGVEEPVRPEQLSPEVIDAIARRVVELMSDKVVREIAWDVVPELAELLVKQKLEEDSRRQ